MITLREINQENYKACLSLKLAKDQEKFVSDNRTSLAKAYIYRDRIKPLGIYHHEEMVGFLMIRVERHRDWYFLWSLMIDEAHQGKGFGKQAVRTILRWMKEDGQCGHAVTTVVEGNPKAAQMYCNIGFEPMSEMYDGEIDLKLKLSQLKDIDPKTSLENKS